MNKKVYSSKFTHTAVFNMSFFTADILTRHSLEKQVMTVNQHAQYQDPKPEAANWNSDIIHYIIYTCAFLTVACQNIVFEKGLLNLSLDWIRAWPVLDFTGWQWYQCVLNISDNDIFAT